MSDYNEILAVRAKELYDTCDIDGKGYITRNEMNRLITLLPLNQQQLEAVFDSLDDDGNGKLTLQEFTDGFGQYIIGDIVQSKKRNSSVFGDNNFEIHDNKFYQSLEGLPQNSIERESASELYEKLKTQNPDVLPDFENLLSKLVSEHNKRLLNVKNLETTISQETYKHEEKVQLIYNEIENQIKQEELKILSELKQKETQIKEDMERELKAKDKHYKELIAKHNDTKNRLLELSQITGKTQEENNRLLDEKEMLEEALEETEANLEDSQLTLEKLRTKVIDEKRNRGANVTNVTQGISTEKEQLLAQLEALREINRKLKDERDEGLMVLPAGGSRSNSPQAEIINFADKPSGPRYEDDNDNENDDYSNSHVESSFNPDFRKMKFSEASQIFGTSMVLVESDKFGGTIDDVDDGIEIDEEPGVICGTPLEDRTIYRSFSLSNQLEVDPPSVRDVQMQTDSINETTDNKKNQDSGTKAISINYKLIFSGEQLPDSVFKIVIVGDTNVGKTALLDRFCTSEFHGKYAQTVGMDFQLRCLLINDIAIALQLWDTAGQERFDAVSKQFFRKSDGVIIVYDVMEQGTFLSLRKWIGLVEENTTDEVMLMILGNKLDLAVNETDKKIPTTNACDLSRNFGALFFEVSALNGTNVNDAFATLASVLKSRQDKDMQDYIKLDTSNKSKSCCMRSTTSQRVDKRIAIIDEQKQKQHQYQEPQETTDTSTNNNISVNNESSH